ncbi:MAG TPA: chromate efflux transporter, partial [Anaerolineales bacterium]
MNSTQNNSDITIPHQSLLSIFLRFLKFGFLAWGGPFAQIAMIRQELVDEEKWVTPARFNRVLAVYQALPGPEAHELCVYFGMIARGRIGAFLGGLGFMLPGFTLMFALSWLYVSYGITSPLFQSIFIGMQPAVAALIVRAVHRIGSHALLENKWLWTIAVIAAIAQLVGINFIITLVVSGLIFAISSKKYTAIALIILFIGFLAFTAFTTTQAVTSPANLDPASQTDASYFTLFWSALRSGLLTFGGAYTVITYLQQDA